MDLDKHACQWLLGVAAGAGAAAGWKVNHLQVKIMWYLKNHVMPQKSCDTSKDFWEQHNGTTPK